MHDSRLQALVSPLPLDEFRTKFWPDQMYAAHGKLERLPSILTALPTCEKLFARYTGRILFSKGSEGPKALAIDQVNPAHLFAMGLSLNLPDIEPILPGASEFLREIERTLGLFEKDVRMMAWIAPRGELVTPHLDAGEVFSVQLQGTKRFYVAQKKAYASPFGLQYGPNMPAMPDHYLQSSDGFPHPKDFEFTEIEMKPGSVLFLPRGVWHRTEAVEDSLSISITLSSRGAVDSLLRELRNLLLQDPDWRRPLYGATNPAARENGALSLVKGLLKKLPKIIESIQAEDLIPPPPFKSPEIIQPLTRFQRIPTAHIEWKPDQLAALDVKIRSDIDASHALAKIARSYEPVLSWLQNSTAAFSVKELMDKFSNIPLNEHQRALAELARSKFLQFLWFKPLPKA